MAWTTIEWACGHTGAAQLYGKTSGRESTVAAESGRQCFACWLVGEWERTNDPRAQREDRYILAGKIAAGKGKRITGLPAAAPIKTTRAALEAERAKLVARLAEIDAELAK